jgi:hypothetical protein
MFAFMHMHCIVQRCSIYVSKFRRGPALRRRNGSGSQPRDLYPVPEFICTVIDQAAPNFVPGVQIPKSAWRGKTKKKKSSVFVRRYDDIIQIRFF